jgi:hypothetical protein
VNCASSVTNDIGSELFGFIGFWFLSSVMSICRNWFSLIGRLLELELAAEVPVVPVVPVVVVVGVLMLIGVVLV